MLPVCLFRGDQSDLHVIIFDEIDAICKVGALKIAKVLDDRASNFGFH